MVRISVQVSSGAARFRVMVQAASIERALEIARRHNPAAECQVSFLSIPRPSSPRTLPRGRNGRRGGVGRLVNLPSLFTSVRRDGAACNRALVD